MRVPAHLGLYDVTASRPTLAGTRCEACGTAFFPPLHIGCEVCGAPESQLLAVPLAARGRLHAFATVHLHRGGAIEAPFTVAEIVLDDGPVIRATMTSATGEGLQIGQPVGATWVVTTTQEDGHEVVEPRFEPMGSEA